LLLTGISEIIADTERRIKGMIWKTGTGCSSLRVHKISVTLIVRTLPHIADSFSATDFSCGQQN
jgi:hypothetical protein